MKKFFWAFLALTALLIMSGTAFGDFVYATSSGHLGTIRVSSSSSDVAPSIRYTGNHASPFLASYWNGSSTSIALIDRNAGASGDIAYIFSPSSLTDYSSIMEINGVYGTSNAGYSENGYALYLTSGSTIYEINTADFEVDNAFDCAQVISDEIHTPEITNLMVDSQLIHVLVSLGDESKYVHFDGQLSNKKNYFLSRDATYGASSMLSYSDGRPVVGHAFGVDTMNNRGKFGMMISTDNPVKAMCVDNSGGFYFATQEKIGDTFVSTIYSSRTSSRFTPVTVESSTQNIRLVRDGSNRDTFAAMTSDNITVITYKNNATSYTTYYTSALGGIPVGIVSATVSGYDWTASSSGCDFSGLGIIAAGLLAFMLRRK